MACACHCSLPLVWSCRRIAAQHDRSTSHLYCIWQDVDGVVLVLDPEHPEQERDVEQSYIRFAQSHNLMMKQCCVLAVSHEDTRQGGWPGSQPKMTKHNIISMK